MNNEEAFQMATNCAFLSGIIVGIMVTIAVGYFLLPGLIVNIAKKWQEEEQKRLNRSDDSEFWKRGSGPYDID